MKSPLLAILIKIDFKMRYTLLSGAFLLSIATLTIAAYSSSDTDTIPEPAPIIYSQVEQDSIRAVLESIRYENSLKRASSAVEKYKTVKFMLNEGELESNLYPAAFEANQLAVELLDSAYNESQKTQALSILQDLNPVILHGAIYWSGQKDTKKQSDFARAYLDTQIMPEMQALNLYREKAVFPQLAYAAAFGATQDNDIEASKRYFEAYLDTDDMAYRQNVIKYYGQACLATGDYLKGIEAMELGALRYPTDMQLLTLAIQTCLDGDMTDRMQPLLDKAIALDPNDEKLLNLQAQLYEKNQEYAQAVEIFNQLAQEHPNSLEIRQHIATCYYNLGASHYNSSIMDEDEKSASRHRRQSKGYFSAAVTALSHILANTPSDMKYLRALASTYAALGDKSKFEEVNRQIRSFGGKEIAFNSMPVLIGSAKTNNKGIATIQKVPTYEEFAAPYITKHLGEWAKRGEFETTDDYKKRLTGGAAESAYNQINTKAEEEYIKNFSKNLVITDLECDTYDIDNEVFPIKTPYGTTYVKVPSKKHEAEAFKAGWETARIRTPKFIIRDNKVALGSITYMVNGKKYTYNADDFKNYQTPKVYVDLNSILADAMGLGGTSGGTTPTIASSGDMIWKDSDVDVDIPVTGKRAGNLYALIIANEHYSNAKDVFGALHDGHSFKEYCVRTLGIPEHQVHLVNNATGNQVRDALNTLARRVKANNNNPEVIFYYAGHGLPDDASKEAYMMPVDANPLTMSTLIPMKEIYSLLGNLPSESTSVFVDACFSGTDRNGDIINEARGVQIKTKEVAPQGNMFVLSATSAQETALPYKEKHHGIFTYYLLKKLQESKGNATLRELSNYVTKNVRSTADYLYGKPQNPTTTTSGNMRTTWEKKKLKP